METLIKEEIDKKTLIEFERKYKKEEALGCLTSKTKFEYAWCLVRSPYLEDWKTGCKYLEELYKEGDTLAKRDYLFYMAVAQLKLKNYDVALRHCNAILEVQPQHHQVKDLKKYIESRMKKEGLLGMAVVGGASVVVGVAAAALAALFVSKSR